MGTNENMQLTVVEYGSVEAGLGELRSRYADMVFDVSSTKGMKEAKEARAEIKAVRTNLEKLRKALKDPILARGRLLDSEAARITDELAKLEKPIDAQIKAEEDRKEREKEEREAQEQRRMDAIREKIALIRRPVTVFSGSDDLEGMTAALDNLVSEWPDAQEFEEFVAEANSARAETVATLEKMIEMAKAYRRIKESTVADSAPDVPAAPVSVPVTPVAAPAPVAPAATVLAPAAEEETKAWFIEARTADWGKVKFSCGSDVVGFSLEPVAAELREEFAGKLCALINRCQVKG